MPGPPPGGESLGVAVPRREAPKSLCASQPSTSSTRAACTVNSVRSPMLARSRASRAAVASRCRSKIVARACFRLVVLSMPAMLSRTPHGSAGLERAPRACGAAARGDNQPRHSHAIYPLQLRPSTPPLLRPHHDNASPSPVRPCPVPRPVPPSRACRPRSRTTHLLHSGHVPVTPVPRGCRLRSPEPWGDRLIVGV